MLRNLPRTWLRRLPAPDQAITWPRIDVAERRKLTVIFGKPGGLDGVLGGDRSRRSAFRGRHYHKWVAETVDGFDGFVAKYRRDGLLIIRLSRDPPG
jgi:hypothetical protein